MFDTKVSINVNFADVTSKNGGLSEKSTMCGSEHTGLSNSLKSQKQDFANSPSSGMALRDLGGYSHISDDNQEDDDELERLIENGELGDVDFQVLEKQCNGPYA